MARKISLLKKFGKLPKKSQKELETLLFDKSSEINDEKWTVILDNVYSMLIKLLPRYNKIRDREIALEKRISESGKMHGFTLRQLLIVRKELADKRVHDYMKKRIKF